MTYIILAAFVLAAIPKNMRIISLCMVANLGLGFVLYDWMGTIDPNAAAAVVTLINFITVIGILIFGERRIQKIVQSLIIVGFIGVDALLTSGILYESYEIVVYSLYTLMFLTIIKGAGHGARNCAKAIYGSYSGRHSHNGNIIHRNKRHS